VRNVNLVNIKRSPILPDVIDGPHRLDRFLIVAHHFADNFIRIRCRDRLVIPKQ
jgi:hypothetical protein